MTDKSTVAPITAGQVTTNPMVTCEKCGQLKPVSEVSEVINPSAGTVKRLCKACQKG